MGVHVVYPILSIAVPGDAGDPGSVQSGRLILQAGAGLVLLAERTGLNVLLTVSASGGPPSGPAGGDLQGTYPNPLATQARGLRETGGPTTLNVGAVLDGEYLRRSGTTLVGGAPGGGDPSKVIASGTSTIAADTSRTIARRLAIASGAHLVIASGGSLLIQG